MSPKDSVVSEIFWVSGVSGLDMKGYSPRRGIDLARITSQPRVAPPAPVRRAPRPPLRKHNALSGFLARRQRNSVQRPLRIILRPHNLPVAHVDDAIAILRRLRIVRDHQHRLT